VVDVGLCRKTMSCKTIEGRDVRTQAGGPIALDHSVTAISLTSADPITASKDELPRVVVCAALASMDGALHLDHPAAHVRDDGYPAPAHTSTIHHSYQLNIHNQTKLKGKTYAKIHPMLVV
jgi:hypothetical protein